jgi:hypothetical protein
MSLKMEDDTESSLYLVVTLLSGLLAGFLIACLYQLHHGESVLTCTPIGR